jgi:CRISPR/Cas system-associated protein Csm6
MTHNAVIFANVGTSLIGNFLRNASPQAKDNFSRQLKDAVTKVDSPRSLETSGHDAPAEELIEELATYANQTGVTASAELQSTTEIINAVLPDIRLAKVHLLATDTVDGMIAARAVQDVLESTSQADSVDLHRIGGLQVMDGSEFVRFGLPEYIRTIYELLQMWPAPSFRRIFNPTGGFKSVVPYMTLIAMLEGAETRYLFERSSDLLELRPLPVSFDESLVERALPVLDETAAQDLVERQFIEEQLGLTQPLYRTAFASLWTTIDGEHFQVSGIGEILRRRFRTRTDPVFLSAAARKDLDGLDPDRRQDVVDGLRRLRSEGLRSSGQHGRYRSEKSDCACLGRNKIRYRVHFVEHDTPGGTDVRVMRAFHLSQHEERDRVLDTIGIYTKDFGDWSEFDDWG